MGPPVASRWGFPCRHFLPLASEWIADGQKKTSWHGEREAQSPVLCGRGFITGWQFMPTENGPGCRRPVGGPGCLWAAEEGRGDRSGAPFLRAPGLPPVQNVKPGEWCPEGRFWCRKSTGFSLFVCFVFSPQSGLDSVAISPCHTFSFLSHSVIECT